MPLWGHGKPKKSPLSAPGTHGIPSRAERNDRRQEEQVRSWTLKLKDKETGKVIQQRFRGTAADATAQLYEIADATGATPITADRRS